MAVHGRRGRAPKTPTLLDVLWVRGRLKLQIKNALFHECWTRTYELQRHRHAYRWGRHHVKTLSLKKAVWRLWLVSKSRTKSSAEGCEQLLRRAANIARLPSSPSHARTARRRLQATRETPPAISIVEVLRAFSCAAPCQFEPRGTTPSRAASLAVFSSNVSYRGRTNLRSSSIQLGSSSMMGFP